MARDPQYADELHATQAVDRLAGQTIRSVELGGHIDERQAEIALQLGDGTTLFIGAQLNSDYPLASLWFGEPPA